MNIAEGNIINFTPDPGRYLVRGQIAKNDAEHWPVIGWAVVVVTNEAGDPDEPIETQLQPVALVGGTPATLSDMVDAIGPDIDWTVVAP